jgi:hypothetical protein
MAKFSFLFSGYVSERTKLFHATLAAEQRRSEMFLFQ